MFINLKLMDEQERQNVKWRDFVRWHDYFLAEKVVENISVILLRPFSRLITS